MKTRNGYVSNSSSSSFILEEFPEIAWMTSEDWRAMIRDLYVGYEKRMEEHRKFIKENNIEDWECPFCAYDLKTDRADAEKELLDQLRGWKASDCCMHDGKIEKSFSVMDEWNDFCREMEERIEEELSKKYDNVYASVSIGNRKEIRNGGCYVAVSNGDDAPENLQIGEDILKYMEGKWDELGICDNADVLKSDRARFVVHFDENEYAELKGVGEEEGEWHTESYTYERLCEVFADWLIRHGKVPPHFDWHRLIDNTLTVNMHEG